MAVFSIDLDQPERREHGKAADPGLIADCRCLQRLWEADDEPVPVRHAHLG
jgi:hypothetical protein